MIEVVLDILNKKNKFYLEKWPLSISVFRPNETVRGRKWHQKMAELYFNTSSLIHIIPSPIIPIEDTTIDFANPSSFHKFNLVVEKIYRKLTFINNQVSVFQAIIKRFVRKIGMLPNFESTSFEFYPMSDCKHSPSWHFRRHGWEDQLTLVINKSFRLVAEWIIMARDGSGEYAISRFEITDIENLKSRIKHDLIEICKSKSDN